MPVTLVGREGHFHGKSLYYIARNLKNLGIGRVVVRHQFSKRYPEPSYYRLTEVRPEMNAKGYFRGIAYGEKVFRGQSYGVSQIESGHKQDWRLIPKDQEEELCRLEPKQSVNILSKYHKIPSLMEIVLEHELKSEKMPIKDNTFICKRKIRKGKSSSAVLDDEV